jgi:hypothetical protein
MVVVDDVRRPTRGSVWASRGSTCFKSSKSLDCAFQVRGNLIFNHDNDLHNIDNIYLHRDR